MCKDYVTMLKKNKYIELFDTVVAEAKYSVADQVSCSLDLIDRVLTAIATDLKMTKYRTDVTISHPLGRFLNRYVSTGKRMCMDLFVSGLPRNNIFFSGIQKDHTEMKISIVIRKLKNDVFLSDNNIFNIFDSEGVGTETKLFATAIKVETTATANKANIRCLRKFLSELVEYLGLDDAVTLTLKDYNFLLSLINKLKNDVDDLKKQLNEGAVKVKRDKKIDDNINDALNDDTVVGFANLVDTLNTIRGEMLTAGWCRIQEEFDYTHADSTEVNQIRLGFMDVKQHPTMVNVTINKKEVKFYSAKFVTPVDEVTGHQKVEYDLMYTATNITSAIGYIHTNLYQ